MAVRRTPGQRSRSSGREEDEGRSREPQKPWYIVRGSYSVNIRIVGWIQRFIEKCQKKSQQEGPLTVKEFEAAERTVLKLLQSEVFPKEGVSVSGIRVLRDSDLIRVQTKLLHKEDSPRFRQPILLPYSHSLVNLLIRETHLTNGHGGVQFLMGKIREKFWVIQGRRAIRKVIHRCVKCLRFTSKKSEVDPAALPSGRVNMTQVFEVTGVDLAGSLFMKNGSKCWVVLFTCAVYRAVHLDFVTSLSTEAFLNAFLRFIKMRGRPSVVHSDNVTNFVLAVNLFKSFDWQRIGKTSNALQIQWKFNPPTAAWWGGWWERLIRSIKDLLKRMLGQSRLDYEDLRTCLAQVQAVINDRPLTTVTEDQKDLIPLTPAMFLQGIQQTGFPKLEDVDSSFLQQNLSKKNRMFREIQDRFRKEYLSQLVQRGQERKRAELRVVLVGEDNKKRLDWSMGRVMELLPGKDQKYRVAKVETSTGVWTRPLQRLYPLEISSSESSAALVPSHVKRLAVKKQKEKSHVVPVFEKAVKSGRLVRPPLRLQ